MAEQLGKTELMIPAALLLDTVKLIRQVLDCTGLPSSERVALATTLAGSVATSIANALQYRMPDLDETAIVDTSVRDALDWAADRAKLARAGTGG